MVFRILSLDGGGAKGIYTLGVIEEIERTMKTPCYKLFDLIYGTSTGAIIACLLSLGKPAAEIRDMYLNEIPNALGKGKASDRSKALRQLAQQTIKMSTFDDMLTLTGIVTTDCTNNRPKIFKSNKSQAFSRQESFEPGFGASLIEAVLASCAAVPYFLPVDVKTINQGCPTLIDGGFVANNPVLFAITDAIGAIRIEQSQMRVLSIGTGWFAKPSQSAVEWVKSKVIERSSLRFIEHSLAASSRSTDFLARNLFKDVVLERLDGEFTNHKCGLLTTDRTLLLAAHTCGRDTFGQHESSIVRLLS